jgi:hypothetical protein
MQAAVVARRKGFWPMSDAASQHILERALTADAAGLLRWHTDPRLRQLSALRLSEGQVVALLGAITAPVFLLGASRGLFATQAAHAARLADIRHLEFVSLDGGHHLHLEADTAPSVAAVLNGTCAGTRWPDTALLLPRTALPARPLSSRPAGHERLSSLPACAAHLRSFRH